MNWFVRALRTIAVTVGGAAAGWYLWQWWQQSRQPEPSRHAEPEPVSEPEPAAQTPEPTVEPVTVSGVTIADPAATVTFANEASDAELTAAGLSGPQRSSVVAGRPYHDLASLDAARGVGPKTLEALGRG